MAINFPTSLDTLTNPTSGQGLDSPDHAGQHSDANDIVEALEAKVGVDGSAVAASHDKKIATLETNNTGTNTGDMSNAAVKTAYEANANTNAVTDAEKTVLGNTSGANTGDQTLPVKATGAEIDTGTDDAKFATPKAIADSSILSDVVDDTTPELGGEMDCGAHSIGFTQQVATGDGTTTIDWKLGNKFKFTFGAQNDTFTFTAPSNPCNLVLVLIQDGTGSRTATWPGTVKWAGGTAPTLSTAGASIDIVTFYFDGTSYFGVASLLFAVPA